MHTVNFVAPRPQELAAPTAMCKRNGKWATIAVKELVVGDLIQLKGGDVIPADSRVRATCLGFRMCIFKCHQVVVSHGGVLPSDILFLGFRM